MCKVSIKDEGQLVNRRVDIDFLKSIGCLFVVMYHFGAIPLAVSGGGRLRILCQIPYVHMCPALLFFKWCLV